MSLTTVKQILAPLSSATDAMSDALQQAQADLAGGIDDAKHTLSAGARSSLRNAQTSGERARRAWYERAGIVRDRSTDAADQAAAAYRHAIDVLSATWNRAVKAARSAGDQAIDLETQMAKNAQVYSQRSASWARRNPHVVAAAVAVAGYLVIRSYRKRKQRRLELAEEVTNDVGDAANDEAVHTQRSA